MLSKQFEITSENGLHARPAASLSRVCNQFQSSAMLQRDQTQVNAKSIMGLLTLAAGSGTEFTITVDGPDEQAAMAAIVDEITQDLGREIV